MKIRGEGRRSTDCVEKIAPRYKAVPRVVCVVHTGSKRNCAIGKSAERVYYSVTIIFVQEPVLKKSFLSALAIACVAAPIAIHAQQPPIIDRQLFFGEVQYSGAQISPDGQYISFLKPYKGTRNIWVKKAGEPFSAARPVVSAEATRPVRKLLLEPRLEVHPLRAGRCWRRKLQHLRD